MLLKSKLLKHANYLNAIIPEGMRSQLVPRQQIAEV